MRSYKHSRRSRAEFESVDYLIALKKSVKECGSVTVSAAEGFKEFNGERLNVIAFAVICISCRALLAVLDYHDFSILRMPIFSGFLVGHTLLYELFGEVVFLTRAENNISLTGNCGVID